MVLADVHALVIARGMSRPGPYTRNERNLLCLPPRVGEQFFLTPSPSGGNRDVRGLHCFLSQAVPGRETSAGGGNPQDKHHTHSNRYPLPSTLAHRSGNYPRQADAHVDTLAHEVIQTACSVGGADALGLKQCHNRRQIWTGRLTTGGTRLNSATKILLQRGTAAREGDIF